MVKDLLTQYNEQRLKWLEYSDKGNSPKKSIKEWLKLKAIQAKLKRKVTV